MKAFLGNTICDFSRESLFMTIETFDSRHFGLKTHFFHNGLSQNNDDIAAVDTFLPSLTTIIILVKPKPMTFNIEKYEILESYALNSIIK
jgi:hypothetical protein